MISFWISVMPPKIGSTHLSRQSSESWRKQRTGTPAGRGRLHLVSAIRGVRATFDQRAVPGAIEAGYGEC